MRLAETNRILVRFVALYRNMETTGEPWQRRFEAATKESVGLAVLY